MKKTLWLMTGIFWGLSFSVVPLNAASILNVEEEIEMNGYLYSYEAYEVVRIIKRSNGNVEIAFLNVVGMVKISVQKPNGEEFLTKRCFTPIEMNVSLKMMDAPTAIYTLVIIDSGGQMIRGTFEK